jgi:hypothetical protein
MKVIDTPVTKVKIRDVIMKLAGGGPLLGIITLLQTPKY